MKTPFVALSFILILSACSPSCSTPCKLNVTKEAHILPYRHGNCKSLDNFPDFLLPKEYCVSCLSCKEGHHVTETAVIKVSYPEFSAVDENSYKDFKMKAGEINIRITTNCGGYSNGLYKQKIEEQTDAFSNHIERNKSHKDKNGKPHFADIKSLGNDMYVQKNIREPYMSGNASMFFHKEDGVVKSMFYCDGEGECSSAKRLATAENAFSIRYRFKGIDAENFPVLDEQVEQVVTGFYLENKN